MANILEKYEKLSQLDTDFSDIKFEEEKYCISLSGGVDSEEWSDLLNKKIIMDESTGLIRTEIIKCKDGSVTIGADELQKVFRQMPTLRSLLLGHASMSGGKVTIQGNTRSMEFGADWDVPKKAFIHVLSCALYLDDVPDNEEDRLAFFDSLRVLGGWDIVARLQKAEESLKEASGRSSYTKEALSPANDYCHMYEWQGIISARLDHNEIEIIRSLQAKGFLYVGCEKINVSQTIYHFRRSRP